MFPILAASFILSSVVFLCAGEHPVNFLVNFFRSRNPIPLTTPHKELTIRMAKIRPAMPLITLKQPGKAMNEQFTGPNKLPQEHLGA